MAHAAECPPTAAAARCRFWHGHGRGHGRHFGGRTCSQPAVVFERRSRGARYDYVTVFASKPHVGKPPNIPPLHHCNDPVEQTGDLPEACML
eukprot:364189-Chlamydomonas_euryale.AAC.26